MGVSVQGIDELGHLLVALDAAEGSLGVEHAGGGAAAARRTSGTGELEST